MVDFEIASKLQRFKQNYYLYKLRLGFIWLNQIASVDPDYRKLAFRLFINSRIHPL